MSRVLVPDGGATWYHELKAVGYYGESDLERFVRQHVASLFPDFHVFPFKKDVSHRITGAVKRPDLAMLQRNYSTWGIIEVELSEHSLSHVLEQTRCFAQGNYNAAELSVYIRDQIWTHCHRRVRLGRVAELVSTDLPRILVIADTHVDEWKKELDGVPAGLCIFQIYKSTRGRYLYRAIGDFPVVPTREVHCRRHPTLLNLLEIIGDFEFKRLGRKNQVDLVFHDTITHWSYIRDNGKSYLQFLGKANPISPNSTYRLLADRAERYYLEAN